MRVLVVATALPRCETHLLIGIQASGIEVHALFNPDETNLGLLTEAGVNVVPFVINKRIQPDAIRKIRSLLEENAYDIVHAIQKHALFNARLALIGRSERLIAYRGIIGNLSFFDPMAWLTYFSPRVDRVICVANAIRNYFINKRFPGFAMPPERFVAIHKGHNVDWYEQEALFDRRSLGIPDDAHAIGCVAAMRRRKGITYLIEALEHIPQDLNVHLVLVGPISDKAITKAMEASPHRDQIHALGFRKDAPAVAGSFDIIVLPSIRREGLPRSIIEGMSQGVPAVVTNSGGSPELIVENENGMIVPPKDARALADAVTYLLRDEERRRRYGAAARRHIIENLRIETTVEKTIQVYRDVLGE